MDSECRVSSHLDHELSIDGRVYREEILWWNPDERRRGQRHGPGILASMLEGRQDPILSLFSINITEVPSTTATSNAIKTFEPPPLEHEILASIPHNRNADAYYCPNENGWIILSKQTPPPTQLNFPVGCHRQPISRANMAHHFHKHEGAALSFHERRSESLLLKERHHTNTENDVDVSTFVDLVNECQEDSASQLSQYVCCQCSLRLGFLSGVVPKEFIWTLQQDTLTNWSETTAQRMFGLFRAIRTVITIIENRLWKANDSYIKAISPGIKGTLGWDSDIQNVFESLGFVTIGPKDDPLLSPPPIQTNTSHGKRNRKRLVRAWLELQSWLSNLVRQNDRHFRKRKGLTLYVELKDVLDVYHAVVSVHRPRVSRVDLSRVEFGVATEDFELSCQRLGFTREDYSPELLGFAYLAQCRCDPAGTPRYFTYLTTIVKMLRERDLCPPLLHHLVAIERCRGRFTFDEILVAATTLGFGSGNNTPKGFSAEFVENAWYESIKQSWQDQKHGAETRRCSNEALRILAEYWNNVRLRAACESKQSIDMNPENAYNTLEVLSGVDDSGIIEACEIKLEEMQKQLDIMREAAACLAEIKNSKALRQFVATRMNNNLSPDCNLDGYGKLFLPTAGSVFK